MANYIQIEFLNISYEQSDILVAELSNIGFEGFEEGDKNLKGFIAEKGYDESMLKDIADRNNTMFSKSIIEETNWNAVWESNFQPVTIDELVHKTPWVGIRAGFHEPIKAVKHEIIITPKMSFGTGHHATTSMMIQQMSEIDFTGKTILDFGTGTGILSILAEKMGAARIMAIDNDEWSIENAKENFQQNNCTKIELLKTDQLIAGNEFDIILANINKNVIIENFAAIVEQLALNGILLLSGLLADDEKDILYIAYEFSLSICKTTVDNNWICIGFKH